MPSSMATPILPLDIIIDILSRLQSKTLIRFKSVSKQWYSLISSPDFINLHLTQTLISQNLPNLIVSQVSLFSSPISDNQNHEFHFSELDHPLKPFCKYDFFHYDPKSSPKIIGSINGVLCISLYDDKSSVILYNPSTKTHRLIPPFSNRNPHFDDLVVFGFGFDSVSRDYKVVRMSQTCKNRVVVYREASVYSLRDDSWKCVTDQTTMGQFVLQNCKTVLVNESLHFIVFDSNSNFKTRVKCFNLLTEIFSIFDLPKLPKFDSNGRSYVTKELGGCFCMSVNYEKPIPGMVADWELVRADLWVMKEHGNEESWFRRYSIRNPASFDVLTHLTPVVYSKDNEWVLLELDDSWFGWYSWTTKRFERVTVHGLPSNFTPCNTRTFLDSLVSLGKGNDKDKDKSKAKIEPKKNKKKTDRDDFLSSGFKLRL
ncbi:F-box protein CPR1-like [Silene latifolia]|uniref:F-box protein CPR1-like n=1 Tax=Silene latifolia TaxID=37657 RepID=UPI003D76D5CA